MNYKMDECPNNLSGIYKINFPNGKIYIGKSNDIKRRMKEHLYDNRTTVDRAIKKYGLKEFELLEEIEPNNNELMQSKEKYWIEYFNSNNKKIGYNQTSGGDGASPGTDNISARFNQQEIEEIYNLLLYKKEIFIYQIAEMYNVFPSIISGINTGKHYYNPSFTYPLRESTRFKKGSTANKKGVNSNNSKFNENDINEVYDLLLNSNMSFEQIAKKKKVCYATISKINRGLSYYREDFSYPLRQRKN